MYNKLKAKWRNEQKRSMLKNNHQIKTPSTKKKNNKYLKPINPIPTKNPTTTKAKNSTMKNLGLLKELAVKPKTRHV